MKNVFRLLTVFMLCFCFTTQVQADNFTDALERIGRDAIQGYVGPGVTLLGAGMNSGWYNSSKSYKLFILPIGLSVVSISVPIMQISDDMRSFNFSGQLPIAPLVPGYSTLKSQAAAPPNNITLPDDIPFSIDDVPTMFGDKDGRQVSYGELFNDANPAAKTYLFGIGGLDSSIKIDLPFKGFDPPSLSPSIVKATMLTVGLNKLPVINNLQVGLSYLPEVGAKGMGSVGMLGLKLQHELTPHIPIVGKMPFLHISAMYAINNVSMESGLASLDFKNWIAQVNGSLDAKVPVLGGAGIYGGLGLEGSKMIFDVSMAQYGLPDVKDLEIKGDNLLRLTIGARLSILIFDIYADANIGSTTILNAGITLLSLNGL